MEEQKRDDKAEQEARAEESKQEAEKLLKAQHEPLTPSLFLGILNGYLLFVYVIATFGAIAFYSGHLRTLKIVFFACIPMLVIPAIVTAWYVRSMLKKKPAETGASSKGRLLDRLVRSYTVMFAPLGNSPIFWLINLALDIYMIAYAIHKFPSHPRSSLAIVACYTIFFCIFVSLIFISKLIDILHDVNDMMRKIINVLLYTYGIAEGSRKFIEGTEPSHIKAHETALDAIKATHKTMELMANTTDPNLSSKADHPSPEVEDCGGDEWINDG